MRDIDFNGHVPDPFPEPFPEPFPNPGTSIPGPFPEPFPEPCTSTRYRPVASVYTSGGPFVVLETGDGAGRSELFLEQDDARQLAAAIEHAADMAARGTETAIKLALRP